MTEGTEQQFLDDYDPSDFERPSITVDVVMLTGREGRLRVLAVKRAAHPFRGRWALPGTFVRLDETLEESAARALHAKTGLRDVFLEQLFTFGGVARDPRTRVITVAYYALVDAARVDDLGNAGDTTLAEVRVPWTGETGGPVDLVDAKGTVMPLAFDHADIVGMAVKRLRGKLDYAPIGFQLLPDTFTLLELQRVHETVLGRSVNKDSFRRRMLASGQIEATGERQRNVDHRPAELYRFTRRSAV